MPRRKKTCRNCAKLELYIYIDENGWAWWVCEVCDRLDVFERPLDGTRRIQWRT